MKKYLLTLCISCTASIFLYGQQYWSKRYDIELGNEYGSQVIARDDGFLIFMWGFCGLNNAEFCYGLIKFDFDGEKQWQTLMYDTIGPNAYIAMAIRNDTILVNTDYKTIPGCRCWHTICKATTLAATITGTPVCHGRCLRAR